MRSAIALSIALALWSGAPASAQETNADAPEAAASSAPAQQAPSSGGSAQGAYSGDLAQLSDEELDQRTQFISERLDDGQLHSQIWQYGFTAGYSLGVVIGTYQAIDERNAKDHKLAAGIVTAVKASFGVARLLYAPNPGRNGSEAIQAIGGETREDRIARLYTAESELHDVEKRAESRWDWQRHAGNLAVNGAGAAVIAGLGGSSKAIESGVVGVVVGTIMTFSMPWRGVDDAEDYRQMIRGDKLPDDPEVSWNLYSTGTGLGIQLDF
jgi:hypothetical protein